MTADTKSTPNAHTLTLKFHRFLSQDEWRLVGEAAKNVPFMLEMEARSVQETALVRFDLEQWACTFGHRDHATRAEAVECKSAHLLETLTRWSRAGTTDDLETPIDAYGQRVLSMVLRELLRDTPEPDSEGGK